MKLLRASDIVIHDEKPAAGPGMDDPTRQDGRNKKCKKQGRHDCESTEWVFYPCTEPATCRMARVWGISAKASRQRAWL